MSRKLTISQTDLERNPLRASNEEITKGTIDVTSSGKKPSTPLTETDFNEHLKAVKMAFDEPFGNKGGTRKRHKRKKKKRRRRKSTKKKRKRRRRKTRKKKRR